MNSKLPIWGQRWSGYRVPHGPSPFSTRIFSVDGMSEVGPTLTSPTQFEMTLTEEDEGEDASSESSRFRGSFISSPLAMQVDATASTSRPETPTPRSVCPSSNHSHGSPEMLHRCTGYPPLHPPTFHGIPIQGCHGSLDNDYTLWDMDRTSTSIQDIQLQAGHSHPSQIPSGQLQHAMLPHSIHEWQLAKAHPRSSTYPFQFDPSSHPGSSCPLQPSQADYRTGFIPTTPPSPSSSHCFAVPFPQHIVAIDSSWNYEPNITMITEPRNQPSGLVLSNPSLPGPLQNSGPPHGLGVFYHSVSDHHRKFSHPEDFFATSAHAEG